MSIIYFLELNLTIRSAALHKANSIATIRRTALMNYFRWHMVYLKWKSCIFSKFKKSKAHLFSLTTASLIFLQTIVQRNNIINKILIHVKEELIIHVNDSWIDIYQFKYDSFMAHLQRIRNQWSCNFYILNVECCHSVQPDAIENKTIYSLFLIWLVGFVPRPFKGVSISSISTRT